jgi:hypothetical protein
MPLAVWSQAWVRRSSLAGIALLNTAEALLSVENVVCCQVEVSAAV